LRGCSLIRSSSFPGTGISTRDRRTCPARRGDGAGTAPLLRGPLDRREPRTGAGRESKPSLARTSETPFRTDNMAFGLSSTLAATVTRLRRLRLQRRSFNRFHRTVGIKQGMRPPRPSPCVSLRRTPEDSLGRCRPHRAPRHARPTAPGPAILLYDRAAALPTRTTFSHARDPSGRPSTAQAPAPDPVSAIAGTSAGAKIGAPAPRPQGEVLPRPGLGSHKPARVPRYSERPPEQIRNQRVRCGRTKSVTEAQPGSPYSSNT
jgi:hypothetical protein